MSSSHTGDVLCSDVKMELGGKGFLVLYCVVIWRCLGTIRQILQCWPYTGTAELLTVDKQGSIGKRSQLVIVQKYGLGYGAVKFHSFGVTSIGVVHLEAIQTPRCNRNNVSSWVKHTIAEWKWWLAPAHSASVWNPTSFNHAQIRHRQWTLWTCDSNPEKNDKDGPVQQE